MSGNVLYEATVQVVQKYPEEAPGNIRSNQAGGSFGYTDEIKLEDYVNSWSVR